MFQFNFLTSEFYEDYAHCPEIEKKETRPYIQIIMDCDGIEFAIPLRSNIKHMHVLWTDKENKCGLDFSKAVVITKPEYINHSTSVYIRENEFNQLRGKEFLAKEKLKKYIRDYKKAKSKLDIKRNELLCKLSTLQYFEEELIDLL